MNKITQVGLSLIAILAILLLLVYGLGAANPRFQTGEKPQKCCLAGPGGAEKSKDLAPFKG